VNGGSLLPPTEVDLHRPMVVANGAVSCDTLRRIHAMLSIVLSMKAEVIPRCHV
jgi:hypothetical protein